MKPNKGLLHATLLSVLFSFYAFDAVAAYEEIPVLAMNADGTLPTDGSQCISVGEGGVAEVYFQPPVSKASCSARLTGAGAYTAMDQYFIDRCELVESYDYERKPLYIMTQSIQGGNFAQQISYHEQDERVLHRIRTDKQPGDVICLKSEALKRVPSLFEVYGVFMAKFGALLGFEALTGGSLSNFEQGSFLESLHGYGALSTQLVLNAQIDNELQLRGGMSQGSSSCSLASIYAFSYLLYFLSGQWSNPSMKALTTTGAFRTFGLSALAGNIMDCADYKLVMPYLSERLYPSAGSKRSPDSEMIGNLIKGPGWLALLYGSQLSNVPAGVQAYLPAHLADFSRTMRVKLTIKSAINTRSFRLSGNQTFPADHPEFLKLVQDGILMMSMHSIDEPSKVMSVFFDEYIKQMGAAAFSYQPLAGASLDKDEFGQYLVHFFETLLFGTIGSAALTHATPVLAGPAGKILSWSAASGPAIKVCGVANTVFGPVT
ncbi:MAG: hypothetical protein ACR2PT_14555, partial [Endozoicomonas sp.]